MSDESERLSTCRPRQIQDLHHRRSSHADDRVVQALLKTLEEPPAHAKFIFATTAAQDVPRLLSLAGQRFDFRRATGRDPGPARRAGTKEKIRGFRRRSDGDRRRADGRHPDGEGILDQLAAFQPDGMNSGT